MASCLRGADLFAARTRMPDLFQPLFGARPPRDDQLQEQPRRGGERAEHGRRHDVFPVDFGDQHGTVKL
jgi:hypothetical protein